MESQSFSLNLRVISSLVLAFFIWTFGGLFDIAFAIKSDQQAAVDNQQKSSSQQTITPPGFPLPQGEGKKPEEKFQKNIEDIEKILSDQLSAISDQHKTDENKNKLRAKKAEVEALDIEIKRQFAETEGKIKDLPEVIRQRHRDFVKKYDDNLNELKDNLDAVDKAGTKEEADAAINKTKAHLEKVRPPSRYQKLDPNKLPHRTEEPVWKEPRTTPEEFQADSDQQLAVSGQRKTTPLSPPLSRWEGSGGSHKPILVASNGPLTGLLSKSSNYSNQLSSFPDLIGESRKSLDARRSLSPQALRGETSDRQSIAGGLPEGSYQIALATPPTAADLSETIEVQFTPAIRAKAAELGYNPVKIYNWTRNNIEYVPTYGSIQGADMCLQTKQCNDMDTASLLIALLRVSGIHAKYIYGTIEVPIEKVRNWVGGFTDTNSALAMIATGGIPITAITSGGVIESVRLEHVWVESWIDMVPSYGAVYKQGDTWLPLDASYKQFEYATGIDLQQAVPFDSEAFLNQLQSSAVIDETTGSVTKIDGNAINLAVSDYSSRLKGHILSNYGDKTGGDIIGKKKIIQSNQPILFPALPYKTVVKGWKQASLPDSLRHKISFSLSDAYGFSSMHYSIALPEISSKRISLSYSPATQFDENIIFNYYQSSSLPAYLIVLKPELRIAGQVVSTGESTQMGTLQNFNISFAGPVSSWRGIVSNMALTGEYYEIGLNLSGSIRQDFNQWTQELKRITTAISNNNLSGLNKEDIIGQSLEGLVRGYFHQYNLVNFINSMKSGVVKTILPSMGMAIQGLKLEYAWGMPYMARPGGISMDIDRLLSISQAKDGDKSKAQNLAMETGIWSSVLEHMIPELFYQEADNAFESISAIKALQVANDLSIPIVRIDRNNLGQLRSSLSVGSDTLSTIEDAVNSGKTVITPSTEFSYKNWTGIGYVILDTNTGAGAYMIGGMGGSEQVDGTSDAVSWLEMFLRGWVEGIGGGISRSTFQRLEGVIQFAGIAFEIGGALIDGELTVEELRLLSATTVNTIIDVLVSHFIAWPLMAAAVGCMFAAAVLCFAGYLILVSIISVAVYYLKNYLHNCIMSGQCNPISSITLRRPTYA